MRNKKIIYDIKDLIVGIGLGLCFSKFYGIGIFLIILISIVCLLELSKKRERK